jgi:methionyl-tRNA formyltransferase
MRIFLIIDETHFYQPNFVAELIKKMQHDIVGAVLVTKVLAKSNIELYMIKHCYYLKVSELFKLGTKKLSLIFKNHFLKNNEENGFYSVKKVYKYFNIDYFEVKHNINREVYLNKIREKKPDIIISSNSMIFGKELLNIPKYCINRHSALLPSYGGLWPVFQAIRKGAKEVGVTVHTMEKKIDKGIILSQIVIPIDEDDTIDALYQKCFQNSAKTVLGAIKKIEENDITTLQNNYESSYYSFPTKEHWRQFRERKIKFI